MKFLQQNLQSGDRFVSSTGYLPWSGFPTYWENIAIRPPFQDSHFTREEEDTFEVLSQRRANLGPNWGQVAKLPTPFGLTTFVLKHGAAYWKTTPGTTNINEVDMPNLDDVRLGEQSVRYFMLDTTVYSTQYLTAKYPMLSIAHTDGNFSVLELPQAQALVRSEDSDVRVSNVRVENNAIAFTVASNSKKSAALLVAEQYYPGWNCTSSQGTCGVTENERGMAVQLDADGADVTLRFLPTDWHMLVGISLLSGLGLLGLGLYTWKKHMAR